MLLTQKSMTIVQYPSFLRIYGMGQEAAKRFLGIVGICSFLASFHTELGLHMYCTIAWVKVYSQRSILYSIQSHCLWIWCYRTNWLFQHVETELVSLCAAWTKLSYSLFCLALDKNPPFDVNWEGFIWKNIQKLVNVMVFEQSRKHMWSVLLVCKKSERGLKKPGREDWTASDSPTRIYLVKYCWLGYIGSYRHTVRSLLTENTWLQNIVLTVCQIFLLWP